MHRLVIALLVATAIGGTGCGVERDDRPYDLDYLTSAIFQPSCGATQCHSQFRQANNIVLDTPEHVRETIVRQGLVRFSSDKYDPENPEAADLYIWITEIDPFGAGIGRMPFDQPLANKDVYLLKTWIYDPARAPDGDGGRARGAQCDPAWNDGLACDNNQVVRCGDDWNFTSDVMHVCRQGCGQFAGPSGDLEQQWCLSNCGDKLVDGTEECDDGNSDSGDGCSDTCKLEAP